MVDAYLIPDIPTKTCTKCGETKPETEFLWNKNTEVQKWYRRPDCRMCGNVQKRARYAANAASINKRVKEKRAANHEASRAKERQWEQTYKAKHPEEYKAYQKAYRLANKEQSRAYHRTYVVLNRDKKRLQARNHYARTKERRREDFLSYAFRRRALKQGAPINDLTANQWRSIKSHYGHCCVYCDRKMERLTQDHITPLSKGGSHTVQNVVPACKSCNSRKHTGPVLRPIQPLLLI